MGKFHPNNLRSVVLDHPTPGGRRQFKLWSASFRRIILDTVRCGTRHHDDRHNTNKSSIQEPEPGPELELEPEPVRKLKSDPAAVTTLRSKSKKGSTNHKTATVVVVPSGSDKLSDLLRLSEKENEEHEEEEVVAVKRKVEALEELKTVVKNLQKSTSSTHQSLEENENCGLLLVPDIRVLEAAKEVRRLTKDDSQARTTLALLGAIPPLVALLDAPTRTTPPDDRSQIHALYALLNLGIGNDA